MDIEAMKKIVNETIKDIVENDREEDKKRNLDGIDITIINMCDCFRLITRKQAEELREPIVNELKNQIRI